MDKNIVEKLVDRLKVKIKKNIGDKRVNAALKDLSDCADILYRTNIKYYDEELELYLKMLSGLVSGSIDCKPFLAQEDYVLFWDGFGYDNRGLAQIYVKALCKAKKVIYVTIKSRESQTTLLRSIVTSCGGYYLSVDNSQSVLSTITQLNTIVNLFKPGFFFYYSAPNDVSALVLMHAYGDSMHRYLINLTDHAFWLGADCIDKCIEFRDYGASISHEYRHIKKKKIVKIPFYPIVSCNKFEGFPFELSDDQLFVFSGGNLYKTFGGGGLYYNTLDYMLNNHQNVLFWYAGNGDDRELVRLSKKYPHRVFHTAERQDLYEVLKRCRFYLNTYPLCGGLMFQYAALAEKFPLTLKYSNNSDGMLIGQKELKVEFDDYGEFINELDKLIESSDYALMQGKKMRGAVIAPHEFEKEVGQLLSNGDNTYQIDFTHTDTHFFISSFIKELKLESFNEVLAATKNKDVFEIAPINCISGTVSIIVNRFMKHNS